LEKSSRNLEAERQRWLQERPQYEAFGSALAKRLRDALKRRGIWAEVSSRAKDVGSMVLKLIRKPNLTYESISDKAGVRVIVRYKDEIDPVLDIAALLFNRAEPEHKVDTLEFDQVGYLSTHVDIRARESESLNREYPADRFNAELQVRTMAQHLWSEMSHDTFYKNDEALAPLPKPLRRRIHVLAGVVEVADDEFTRIERDMPQVSADIELLKALERHYHKLTAHRADHELSLELIRLLKPLYAVDPKEIAARIDGFYTEHEDMLRDVYDAAAELPERSAFLYQPEALMIYDLLNADQLAVRKAWNEHFPEKELERLANAFGISFD
jgi:ppGpp synthetase/RelA/SpoT-type nucleotidyltranferase